MIEIRAIPVRPPAGDRRQQIMQVARELLVRHGVEGTTISQIAEHAQVNEAVLFRHFRKEDLYWIMIDPHAKYAAAGSRWRRQAKCTPRQTHRIQP